MAENDVQKPTAEELQQALSTLLRMASSERPDGSVTRLDALPIPSITKTPRSSLSPTQAVSDYIDEKIREKGWTGNTLTSRPGILRRFADWIQVNDVGAITKRDIEEFRQFLWRRDLADSTVNLNLTAIRAFFTHLVTNEIINQNPALHVRVARMRRLAPRRPMPEAGLDALLRRFEGTGTNTQVRRKHLLPRLMCLTGLRPGEATQVTVDDIIEEEGVTAIDLRRVANRGGRIKTRAGARMIPLSPQAMDILEVFDANWSDKPWASRDVANRFGRFLKNSGFGPEFSLYSCRYRVASLARSKRIAEADVAAILGHTHQNLTFGLYGAEVPISVLADVVEKLQIETL